MARREFKIDIHLIDHKSPHTLNVLIVDKSILNESDLHYVLGTLPPVTMARIDSESYKPFLGIDMFYDITASLKGCVLVHGSQALVIRVPDDVAKTSSKRYESEQEAARKAPSKNSGKLKGRPQKTVIQSRLTSSQCLRRLFESDLVGFGMAQISLTLWHYLRERVSGVNLSTATSEQIPPPKRSFPEPQNKDDTQQSSAKPKGRHAGSHRGKDVKGGERKRNGGRDGVGRKRGPNQRHTSSNDQTNEETADSKAPAILPDDEPLNWDREIQSPGDVLKKVYPNVSRIEVDTAFIGNDGIMDMEARVAEAATRAWVSYLVAHELNSVVQNAPVVQPSRLQDKELTFFAESMVVKWKVLGETSPLRRLQLEHYDDEGGNLRSTKYETKLRAGSHQYITYNDGEDEKRLFMQQLFGKPKEIGVTENEDEQPETTSQQKSSPEDRAPQGRGRGTWQRRQGQVRDYGDETSEPREANSAAVDSDPIKPAFRLPKNTDVYVYGRDDAIRSDELRDMFILRLLEGRGALHGLKYRDCAFIRRVWFPTYDQKTLGEQRKKEKLQTVRGKHDWVDDDWGDDTDEDEVVRIQTLKLKEGESDQDDETEDENIGKVDPTRGVSLPESIRLNSSQRGVVGRMVAPNPRSRTRATLVHGPPGTGKTSTIAAAVLIFAEIGQPTWIIAQSNVGIKNVAQKLQDVGFNNFTLLVSQDYHAYWQERYSSLQGRFFTTSRLRDPKLQKQLFESKAVLCTLATLSSNYLEKYGVFNKLPLRHLIIDEASQIDMASEFMHIFYKHRSTLKSVCWFGDPNQLPPFGWSEGTEIQDIFKIEHLLANSRLLDTSYRLPIPIAEFISRAVYRSELKPFMGHKVKSADKAIVFVDVADGLEEGGAGSGIGGTGASWQNTAEAEVTVKLIQNYYKRDITGDQEDQCQELEYAVITPFDGQRILVTKMFEEAGIQKQVYNLDSFQGNEADYIITSITKTGGPGFLTSVNRLNVLLTRCKRGLVIVTQKDFVQRIGGLLLGLFYSVEPYDPWVSAEDVVGGYVDLPGSPAPHVRPPPEIIQLAPASRTSLPSRPGARPPPLIAQIVQQGTEQSTDSSTVSADGPQGYRYGMNRVQSSAEQ